MLLFANYKIKLQHDIKQITTSLKQFFSEASTKKLETDYSVNEFKYIPQTYLNSFTSLMIEVHA